MSRAQSKPLAAPKPQPPAPETLREEVVRLFLHNYDQARQGRVPTREDIEDSLAQLKDVELDPAKPLPQLIDTLLNRFDPAGGEDDVAVLAARLLPPQVPSRARISTHV